MVRPPPPRAWTAEAVRRIEADRARSADTHLLRMHFAGFPGVLVMIALAGACGVALSRGVLEG